MKGPVEISIVIPVRNEKDNVRRLHGELRDALEPLKKSYEIIFVDDGSTDGTIEELQSIKDITVIRFRKNFGQSAAMLAGFRHAKGDIVITMDGDGQNDPADILNLLDTLDERYDVVCGWRRERKDPFFKRTISRFANWLRLWLTEETIHDSGCSLRAYRRDALKDLEIYGEMHRYIPALLLWKGYRIGEVKVNHRERRKGRTKYNWQRLLKGFLDLIVVVFWEQYSARPIHVFGGLGLVCSSAGILLGGYLFMMRVLGWISLAGSALPLLAAFLFIIGLQFFISGILADILIKLYYGRHDVSYYNIEEIVET